MLMAMDRRIPYLSLAAPGREGVRQFKDHFHPELIDNTRFVSVHVFPAGVTLARGFIGQTQWLRPIKSLLGRRSTGEKSTQATTAPEGRDQSAPPDHADPAGHEEAAEQCSSAAARNAVG